MFVSWTRCSGSALIGLSSVLGSHPDTVWTEVGITGPAASTDKCDALARERDAAWDNLSRAESKAEQLQFAPRWGAPASQGARHRRSSEARSHRAINRHGHRFRADNPCP